MKSVMLTGATGFVGSHIAEALLEKNIKLSIFSRRQNDLTKQFERSGASIFTGENTDKKAIAAALEGVDTVIHAAGATKGICEDDYIKANTDFTGRILSFLNESQKFIYISSQAAAGPSSINSPITEEKNSHPLTYYGKSKLVSENLVREWGSSNGNNYIILRPSSVYGPREKDIFTYFKLMSRGLFFLLGTGEKKISIIYVKDLVSAIITAAESSKKGETFFVCNDEGVNWLELGEEIKKAVGKKSVIKLNIPEKLVYPIGFASDILARITRKPALLNNQKLIEMKQEAWLCSNKKIKEILGWKSGYTLSSGIKETADWYFKEGWI